MKNNVLNNPIKMSALAFLTQLKQAIDSDGSSKSRGGDILVQSNLSQRSGFIARKKSTPPIDLHIRLETTGVLIPYTYFVGGVWSRDGAFDVVATDNEVVSAYHKGNRVTVAEAKDILLAPLIYDRC